MTRRVVFDGSVLAHRPWTGVASSFVTTLRHWLEEPNSESIVVVPDRSSRDLLRAAIGEAADIRVEPGLTGPLRPFVRSRIWRRLGPAIWHSPVAALPALALDRSVGFVATVHDLAWSRRRELDGERPSQRHRRAMRRALRAATTGTGRVLVPSRATADDIARTEGPSEVVVCPPGIERPTTPPHTDRAGRRGPFVVLGDDRPRKNVERVKRAHALARAQRPELPDLLIAGPVHGFVDEDQKDRMLSEATALLHLSLHEGFGMPIVEAFARGTPVIASRIPAIEEVAGDAALLVDPHDESSIAEAMVRVFDDTSTRDRLARAGVARSTDFDPRESAAIWRSVHRSMFEAREDLVR